MQTSPDSSARPARELLIVAGHLALDFANTVDDPNGPAHFDHLGTYPLLLGWSVRYGLLRPEAAAQLARLAHRHPRDAGAALASAHTLRVAISDTFGAVAAGASAEPPFRDLQPFAVAALEHAELATSADGFELSWPDSEDLTSMLWPVAHAALTLLTGSELGRVKRCVACPWLFLDHSKNSSRRWCTMDDCGKSEKMRRYVARRAERRQGATPRTPR